MQFNMHEVALSNVYTDLLHVVRIRLIVFYVSCMRLKNKLYLCGTVLYIL